MNKLGTGINLTNLKSNSKYVFRWSNRFFHFSIIAETDLSVIIERFKRNNTYYENSTIYVMLDFKKKYMFAGQQKTIANCVAILSDFVDGFIFENFSDIQEDIDPIIMGRLYSDNQYLIYLAPSRDSLHDEVLEMVEQSRLSSIDGLYFSDMDILELLDGSDTANLEIIFSGINKQSDLVKAHQLGANRYCVSPKRCYYRAFRTLRKLSPDILDKSASE